MIGLGGTAALLIGTALALGSRRSRSRADADQDEIRRLQQELAEHRLQAERLAQQTIPEAVRLLREGGSAATVLAETEPELRGPQRAVLRSLVEEVGASERKRASGMAACANAAGRVQALATSMLADLREMENRHGEEVLGDLLRLDHGTAQAGRLADSIAVLTGARSGRRWTRPIVMESVLRGAMGRISAYQRVRVHSASTAAIAGYAAEGVMHALAELMDNATTFSPPTEEVHVYVQEVHSGLAVTIEDAGLVMPPATLARAEQLVSSAPLDLTGLSGTRLGLAVVGCLARKHGLTVSFRPSARGGTGVVVLIPPHLVTQPQPQQRGGGLRTGQQSPGAGAPTTALLSPAVEPVEAEDGAAQTLAEREPTAPAGRELAALPKRVPGTAVEDTAKDTASEATEPAAGGAAPPPDMEPAAGGSVEPADGDVAAGGAGEPLDAGPAAGGSSAPGGSAARGLPKRARGETLAAATAAAAARGRAAVPAPAPARPAADIGARFAAFQAATRSDDDHGPTTTDRTDR
ncbi:sensor histidine kinase [Streptacidiphilus cavernicola]|uniref:histidine kinase n=1 Tax=Streptacidiphilus cavernicola TaxID=3342716 RepID=A0ABV6VWV1_9ACTN